MNDESSVVIDFDDELLEATRYLNIRRLKSKRALNRKAEANLLAMLRRVRGRPFGAGDHWLEADRLGWHSFAGATGAALRNPQEFEK